jgi:hypothetical protein
MSDVKEVMPRVLECPHCGSLCEEELCDCVNADGYPDPDCLACSGAGGSGNYYCSQCGWEREE